MSSIVTGRFRACSTRGILMSSSARHAPAAVDRLKAAKSETAQLLACCCMLAPQFIKHLGERIGAVTKACATRARQIGPEDRRWSDRTPHLQVQPTAYAADPGQIRSAH